MNNPISDYRYAKQHHQDLEVELRHGRRNEKKRPFSPTTLFITLTLLTAGFFVAQTMLF